MQLNDTEKSMRNGDLGEPRRWAIEQQIAVAEYFGAEDFVPVSQVHICADSEALGENGIGLLERFSSYEASEKRVLVPSLTDPRGSDFGRYKAIRQDLSIVERERRLADALRSIGFMMTNTCINYQCVLPPVQGERLAFGDTGSVIYANAVQGARSNFEGGPAALAAALTGRVPRYGYHLAHQRLGTQLFRITEEPRNLSEWGIIGGIIGRIITSYWEVPVIEAAWSDMPDLPTSDSLKHLGAALASYGSIPMFHFSGLTPEAPDTQTAFGSNKINEASSIGRKEFDTFRDGFQTSRPELDVVVFAAPQLSIVELRDLAALLDGRKISKSTAMLIAVPPSVKIVADQSGLSETIEAAGAVILEGVCFYQMHARELAQANGWQTLMSNSAKLVNIVGGYGYEPVLGTMAHCVDAAIDGRVPR